MGLGFNVDTPLKVARFGISSVVCIMDDQLLEDKQWLYTNVAQFEPINEKVNDFRCFAKSKIRGGVVFSTGLHDAHYGYAEQFKDFFPNENGVIKKPIILKVSDYRSALIQGKFLAKKGLWVDEYRIDSGLNCGGYAFATDGFLAGPLLDTFNPHCS